MMSQGALSFVGLTVQSASRTVVRDVSLHVEPGTIVSVLGPNGAGKSELVLAAVGMMPKSGGTVSLGDVDLTLKTPDQIRGLGVAAVPEGHQILTKLNVDDNLRAAGSMHGNSALLQAREDAYGVFPELRPLGRQPAGSLSGGQQHMVALAQALICGPKFLLVDEMSLGLAPIVIDRLMAVLQQLKSRGIGILLIEQFTHIALAVSDHCYVLNQGRLRFSGAPIELQSKPEILHSAYLAST